jgi:hypothetical protein
MKNASWRQSRDESPELDAVGLQIIGELTTDGPLHRPTGSDSVASASGAGWIEAALSTWRWTVLTAGAS